MHNIALHMSLRTHTSHHSQSSCEVWGVNISGIPGRSISSESLLEQQTMFNIHIQCVSSRHLRQRYTDQELKTHRESRRETDSEWRQRVCVEDSTKGWREWTLLLLYEHFLHVLMKTNRQTQTELKTDREWKWGNNKMDALQPKHWNT